MRNRKRLGDETDTGTWLNTYADMVTLLLTFFAVMLSFSSVNEEKFNAFVESLQARYPDVTVSDSGPGNQGLGGTGEPGMGGSGDNLGSIQDLNELYYSLDSFVNESAMQDDVQLVKSDDVLYIRFNNSMLFQPDSAKLLPGSEPVLEKVAGALKQCESQIQHINICGYTASTGDPNYGVSSWMLSGERAAAVADYLDGKQGFPEDKMIVMGYGNTNPVKDNGTAEGRQANRRVELVIIGNSLDNAELKSFYDSGYYPTYGGAEDLLNPGAPSGGRAGDVEKNVSPYDD
ncbi:flagellar motor protein MotB [Butyricicoccus faecihominis]|uniref:OmpA/MotB family protein n=1 Tax=Butyricicoccus faecihominis TaxID=1712515 RepID=UPI00247A2C42|nr:flagellar motor protein MotB [Butyricicoccus faecihominis]MCQ5130661.1 flagellar motor protein MotB [Butyricicoccus faecihominis]